MESITEAFQLIGLCTCVYTIAQLLYYGSLKLQDDPNGSVLCPILSFICIGLWILSLPVTIVLGLINKLHSDRLRDIVQRETKEETMRTAELLYKQPARKEPPPPKILNPFSPVFDKIADHLIDRSRMCLSDNNLPVSVPALLAITTAAIHSSYLVRDYRVIRDGLVISVGCKLQDLSPPNLYPNGKYQTLTDEADAFWDTLDLVAHNSRDAAEAAVHHAFPDTEPSRDLMLSISNLFLRFEQFLPKYLGGFCIAIPDIH